jgi:hypothetical protein
VPLVRTTPPPQVRETLTFTALLRLDRTHSRAQKRARAEEVIAEARACSAGRAGRTQSPNWPACV